MFGKLFIWVFVGLFMFVPLGRAENGQLRDKVTQPVDNAVKIRQNTQKQEEKWRDEKQKLIARYEQLRAENDLLEKHHRELVASTDAARKRVSEKDRQLADINEIQNRIDPFLEKTAMLLKKNMADDMPFLIEERWNRIDRLEQILDDPDVSVSEKYRKAMEALMVEAEYGNTIEVYQQTIYIGGSAMLVNIFRLGRISLFFQSLDHSRCGFYNVASGKWEELPHLHNRAVGSAIEIGARRKPVELLSLPLGKITVK